MTGGPGDLNVPPGWFVIVFVRVLGKKTKTKQEMKHAPST
jgi:hypothetical protein